MKFICTIPCVEAFHQVKELCDGVVMTNSHLSARYDSSFTNEEILQIVKKCNTHKMESFILIDNILFDSDLEKIYNFIDEFKETNLYYIFSDLAVYQILK